MPLDVRRIGDPRGAEVGAALILLAAIAAAYSNALGASFQFDDWDVIVRDPRVQGVAAWWASMPGIRPLLKLSYAFNHASGFGAVGFHAVNVAIHAINGLIAMDLARRLAVRQGFDATSTRWLALATALVFALHPVQTEAVTYASGRSASLSTGFALASLALWLSARDRSTPSRWAGVAFLVASLIAMGMALAVKETAVVVPAALMLWAITDPARPAGLRESLRVAFRATAFHWLVLGSALCAALALPAYRAFVGTSLATRSPIENLVAQTEGVFYLLGQLVRVDRLNADPMLPAVTTLDAAGILIASGIVAILGLAFAVRRRWPIAAFAFLWTALWLLPTNSLLARLDLVNDRQWYGALFGPALLVGLGVAALARRTRVGTGLALAVLVIAAGVATHRRNEVYRDELRFWRDVIAQSPHNARAFNNLGIALADTCDETGAVEAWRRALALDPGFVRAAVNLRLAIERGIHCNESSSKAEPSP